MAAHRKSDQRRVCLCAVGVRKSASNSLLWESLTEAPCIECSTRSCMESQRLHPMSKLHRGDGNRRTSLLHMWHYSIFRKRLDQSGSMRFGADPLLSCRRRVNTGVYRFCGAFPIAHIKEIALTSSTPLDRLQSVVA